MRRVFMGPEIPDDSWLMDVPSQAEVVGCIVWWEGLHPVQVITIQSIAFLVLHTDHRQHQEFPSNTAIIQRQVNLDLNVYALQKSYFPLKGNFATLQNKSCQ